jgi:hypothetical protein
MTECIITTQCLKNDAQKALLTSNPGHKTSPIIMYIERVEQEHLQQLRENSFAVYNQRLIELTYILMSPSS